MIADVFNGQTLNGFSYVRNNPLTLIDPSGFTEEEAWRLWRAEETGPLGLHLTFDKLAQPTLQAGPGSAPSPAPDIGASAQTIDMGTMGPGDTTAIPVVETTHPSGPGTDDPFGVYPPDIDLDRTPITTFDQLATGSPTAGRRTLIIEDEPGIARDLRYVLGPPRELVVLRPRLGGEEGDAVSRAKQNLLGEAILTAVTLLTPGTLDDIAAEAATRAARGGGAGVVRTGQTAEQAVRAIEDIGPKTRIEVGPNRYRIPDGINPDTKILTEIKNVNKLSYTRQLRDYAKHAKEEGLTFHLWVKPTTKLSNKLLEEVNAKRIIRRVIP